MPEAFTIRRATRLLAAVALTASATGAAPLHAQAPLAAGAYALVARHSGMCLDVGNNSTDDGAPLQQWTCHGGANQQWSLQLSDDGSYLMVAASSGKAADVTDWSLSDGAPVQQWTVHGGGNQQWVLHPVGEGYYTITARHSGLALDVRDVSRAAGARVQQWALHGGENQQWLLRPLNPVDAHPAGDTVRFLEQSTWGPTPELIERVRTIGFEQFLSEQLNAPVSEYPALPLYPTTRDTASCPNNSTCQRDNYTMYPVQNRFFVNGLYGEDQLRQRVAFALHQILVVSGVEVTQPSWITPYLQILLRDAFGSYRQVLYDITLNAAMGNYLDMNGNSKTRPNENYAREVLQLFSVGTVRLNPDGTSQLDGSGRPIATYDQTTVDNFARVFTSNTLNENAATTDLGAANTAAAKGASKSTPRCMSEIHLRGAGRAVDHREGTAGRVAVAAGEHRPAR